MLVILFGGKILLELEELPQDECVELSSYCCPHGWDPSTHSAFHHNHYEDLYYYYNLNPYRGLGYLYGYVPFPGGVKSDGGDETPSRRPVGPQDMLIFPLPRIASFMDTVTPGPEIATTTTTTTTLFISHFLNTIFTL